jgi:anionic cell wall polymer biosynthesis LytR-Cps2A-Psr (LCP) family protein
MENNKKRNLALIIALLAFLFLGFFILYSVLSGNTKSLYQLPTDAFNNKPVDETVYTAFQKAIGENDSLRYAGIPDEELYIEFCQLNTGLDKEFYTGKRINILVTGVDSRLGAGHRLADANHVVSINLTNGTINIVAIPRDTPTDFSHLVKVYTSPDSSTFVWDTAYIKLTETRPLKGRETYMDQVELIGGFDRMHYWCEFGFSQALGILEFLGFKEPKTALQVLRSRKSNASGDYQRCYNQAQFIRQMILKYFNVLDGIGGNIILRGMLSIIETDLTYDAAKKIYNELKSAGFASRKDQITVSVKPSGIKTFHDFDYTDERTFDSLKTAVARYYDKHGDGDTNSKPFSVEGRVLGRLNNAIRLAEADTAKRPQLVVNKLNIYYIQRAWLQIQDRAKREELRDKIADMLIRSYAKLQDTKRVREIKYTIESEKALFGNKDMLNNNNTNIKK